jgi:hypothetical protein
VSVGDSLSGDRGGGSVDESLVVSKHSKSRRR